MNKKINDSFVYLIVFLFASIFIFFKLFAQPKESDINWLESNYQFIINSSLETPNLSMLTYREVGEIPHDVDNNCKNLLKKNINYFDQVSVRTKDDGTNSIIVRTWTNYYIYKNNRLEQPMIGLPIVKKHKGWIVINNWR
jgi:hypothetical protein